MLKKEPYVTPDMVELGDGMRDLIAEMADQTVRAVLTADYPESFALFPQDGSPTGSLDVFFNTERELKLKVTLSEAVQTALLCSDDYEHLASLADEFERLAEVIRSRIDA